MFLHLYAGRLQDWELRQPIAFATFRGTRHQCERIARQAQKLAAVTPVLAAETGYSPSQLTVLHAIADDQEATFLADIEANF